MSCDYKDFEKLLKNLQELEKNTDKLLEDCAKELAKRLLANVIRRTPVDTGTLRRGWTAEKDAASYIQSLNIRKTGGTYTIEIINPIKYASYVEYGHRTKDLKGWVEGKLMLTISENEIVNSAPHILENKIKKELEKAIK